MVESLENKVSSHSPQTTQDDSIWNKLLAVVLIAGISTAAAYFIHEFFSSEQYRQIEQQVNNYFYQRYYPR